MRRYPVEKVRTNDEVNLRSERERKELVAHELVHFKVFDDTHLRNALRKRL